MPRRTVKTKLARSSASAKPAKASAPAKEATSKSFAKPKRLVDGDKIQLQARRHGKAAASRPQRSTTKSNQAITGAGVKKPKKSLGLGKLSSAKKLLKPRKKSTAKAVKAPKVTKASQGATKPSRKPKSTSKSALKAQRRQRQELTRADLINAESRLGSTIFGSIPAGHRREFFHDQQNIWIWHEAWTDEEGHARQMTVRYEVRPSGVYKKLSAGKYVKLEKTELENFRRATHVYLHRIKRDLYHRA